MATSDSDFRNGYVAVEIHACGSNVESEAQNASLAVANWLETQDTSWLRDAWHDYRAEINGVAKSTESSRRYGDMLAQAREIARKAAMAGWANQRADISLRVDSVPEAFNNDT